MLLAKGAKTDARNDFGATPLHRAASHGWPEAIKLLLAHKADINARDNQRRTPLYDAATGLPQGENPDGQLKAITLLIALKADLNARDKQGLTPLGLALKEKKLKAAADLRQQGAKE